MLENLIERASNASRIKRLVEILVLKFGTNAVLQLCEKEFDELDEKVQEFDKVEGEMKNGIYTLRLVKNDSVKKCKHCDH